MIWGMNGIEEVQEKNQANYIFFLSPMMCAIKNLGGGKWQKTFLMQGSAVVIFCGWVYSI